MQKAQPKNELVTEDYVVMNRTYQEPGRELGLVIRPATCQDTDDLTAIGRSCFPDLLRWRGPKFHTRRWWRALIEVDYCEMWVCLSHGQMIAFIAFVLDRAQYEKMLSRHRPGLLAAFYMFATCPSLFIRKALQKLKENSTKGLRKLLQSASNGNELCESEGPKDLLDGQIPLVGLIAVVPSMQGKGVGTEMLKFCLQRAKKLGYSEIRATIERGNTKSIGLFQKFGFAMMTNEGQHNLSCRKTLTSGELNARMA